MLLTLLIAGTVYLAPLQDSPVMDAPMPANAAQLDAMLETRDFAGLGLALSDPKDGEALFRNMNWERIQTIKGAPLVVTFLYIRDLRAMAELLPEPGKAQNRESASMMALAAYAVITIDGAYCADGTAPAHQMNQLARIAGDSLSEVDKLPLETRKVLARIVPQIEAHTASSRLRDGYNLTVCRGGMAEMSAALKAGPPKEVPTPKGRFGRSFQVDAGPAYKPELTDPAVAAKIVAERRTRLPQTLTRMLKL
jgi:hypothetical protein